MSATTTAVSHVTDTTAWLSKLIMFRACDAQGRLLSSSEVVGQVGNGTTPPPVSGGGACQ